MICENMSIWCWLIPAIVGIICAILGYLLGRLFGKKDSDNSLEINNYKNRISKLEADLASCNKAKSDSGNSDAAYKKTISKLEADLVACNARKKSEAVSSGISNTSSSNSFVASNAPSTTIAASNFDAGAAKLVFGKKIKEDDLKIVEGIGPKIEGLFHNFGIKTWKALSETSVDKCQEVLNSGGDRYRIHKPATWPRQAGLAAEGKFKELLKWQDELDGGK